MIKKTLFSTK